MRLAWLAVTRNGILETTAHHPYAGEDQSAETDDSARVDSERLERPHERLSPGEIHRPLCVSNASERERKESGRHDAKRVNEFVGKGSRPLLAERPIELGYSSGRDNTDTAVHRHLLRLESVGYAVSVWRAQSAVQYFLFIG